MKNKIYPNWQRNQGFTLIELMIASTLGLIVIAVVGSLFMNTRQLNDLGMARVAVQQDLRTAGALITRDARMAGSFGCMSLGRLYGADISKAISNDFAIEYDKNNPPSGIAALSQNPADGSFGVRWVQQDDLATSGIPSMEASGGFTPQSGALVFYYGAGSTGIQARSAGRIQFVDNDPNKTVENTVNAGGYVVATSCQAVNIQSAKTVNEHMSFDIPGLVDVPPKVNEHSIGQLVLLRYMVTAYVVGNVAGEPTSLYRFELQDNGAWSPPELLARNVTAMAADFVFVPNCPSVLSNDPNNYTFTARAAGDGNTILNADGDPQPPVMANITLTYNYPKALGKDTNAQMNNNQFQITAAMRGGNICANRKLPAPIKP